MKKFDVLLLVGVIVLAIFSSGCMAKSNTAKAQAYDGNGFRDYSTYTLELDNGQVVFVVRGTVYAGHMEDFMNKAYEDAGKYASKKDCKIVDVFHTVKYPGTQLVYFTMSCGS